MLRKDLFGIFEGLHIGSYKNYVDGYKINIRNTKNEKLKNKDIFNGKDTKNNL